MHVDSWWDSYLEHGGTEEPPKTSVYIYIAIVHTIQSFYYMNIQCRQLQYSKYIIYTQDFQNARRQLWDSYLEHGGTPKTSV